MPAVATRKLTAPRPPLAHRGLRLARRGGLIVVGGPPYGGKGALAASLVDWIPRSVKIEAIDRLPGQSWQPEGPGGPKISRPERPMLKAAEARLADGRGQVTVIVVARFADPDSRARALACARRMEVPFLHVEACSGSVRALRRLFGLATHAEDAARQMEHYARVTAEYVKVDAAEARTLPSIRLTTVLRDVELAVRRVVSAWASG